MKKSWIMVSLSIIAALTVVMAACATDTAGGGRNHIARPGVFVTQSRGYVDNIVVETQLSSSRIVSVRVLQHRETHGFGNFAVDLMPGRIVRDQTLATDVVTGATVSSMAILDAVGQALVQANARLAGFYAPPLRPAPVNRELNVDVVVVGAGGAGLAAAIATRNQGLDVLIIEKMDVPGGNTIRSSGNWNTSVNDRNTTARMGPNDQLIRQTMLAGHWLNERRLVEYMVYNATLINSWLRILGMETEQGLPSAFRTPNNVTVGAARGLILNMLNVYQLRGGNIMYRVRATEILMSGTGANRKAVGVRATDLKTRGELTINAKAVVIAAGGFGRNFPKIVEFRPDLEGFISNNTPAAQGDGIWMAQAIGAQVVHMDKIQTHPTVDPISHDMLTEGIRTNWGGILLNLEGRRFTNETAPRDYVTRRILQQNPETPRERQALLVWNNIPVISDFNIGAYLEMGLITPFGSMEEIAAYAGFDAAALANLKQTMAEWSDFIDLGWPARQGRDPHLTSGSTYSNVRNNNVARNPPWFAKWIQPGIHYTMGGVAVDLWGRVLCADGFNLQEIPFPQGQRNEFGETIYRDGIIITGRPIRGLYAGGEVIGGIFGGNRQGGNAITNILLFGRMAGFNAARFARGLEEPTHPYELDVRGNRVPGSELSNPPWWP